MTKARTIGAKRRAAKGGRPRKDGERKNGRRTEGAKMLDAMRPTLERRCRLMMWGPDNLQAARDAKLGTTWGQLTVHGVLTARQCEGLDRYWVALTLYRGALGAPSPFAKGATLDETQRGLSGELSGSEAMTRRQRLEEAEDALIAFGLEASEAVRTIMDDPTLDWTDWSGSWHDLRDGAETLAEHFGVSE